MPRAVLRILSYHNVVVPATTAHSLYTTRTSAELSLRARVLMIAARGRSHHSFSSLYGFRREERPGLEISLPPSSNKPLSGLWRRAVAARWIANSSAPGSFVYVTQARPLRQFARLRAGRRRRFILVVECHSLREAWGSEITTADGLMFTSSALQSAMFERFPRLREKPSFLSHHRIAAIPPVPEACELERRDGPIRLGYVGSILPWKGLEVLIDAIRLLPDSFHAHIIGGTEGDEYRSKLIAFARSQGVAERVRFTPFLPTDQLASTLRSLDCLVLPLAAEDQGSSPMKLLEYLAASRPVIASDLPSIREVLTHRWNGLLFAPGDPQSLAIQARSLMETSLAERVQMISRGIDALRPRTTDVWLADLFAWLETLPAIRSRGEDASCSPGSP